MGEDQAALLVSKEEGGPSHRRHQFLGSKSLGGTKVVSWTMRGQMYTLAFAGPHETRTACLLCHAGVDGLPVLD